ncbi:MAG: D-glycero-beta-D-manno-heptose 1-phosphate adenylyltransferase [Cyclobacteriaceae bacterium]
MQSKEKVLTRERALQVISNWKDAGEEVVFTNGCFDIVHLGHVDYLEKARNLGDRLIVAVNEDQSVKKLKGENRPINDENARARVIASFGFVDAVVLFGEETPKEIIDLLLPDILVKGKDYNVSNIVGADVVIEHGGKVETIDLVDGYSTTKIVEKIKK